LGPLALFKRCLHQQVGGARQNAICERQNALRRGLQVTPSDMVPAGGMAKRVVARPDWLHAERVSSIYSVSGCISEDFADYINFWKHNGY